MRLPVLLLVDVCTADDGVLVADLLLTLSGVCLGVYRLDERRTDPRFGVAIGLFEGLTVTRTSRPAHGISRNLASYKATQRTPPRIQLTGTAAPATNSVRTGSYCRTSNTRIERLGTVTSKENI